MIVLQARVVRQFLLKWASEEKNVRGRLLFNSSHTGTSRMSTTVSEPGEKDAEAVSGVILSRSERAFLFSLAFGIVSVMTIAMWLTPDPRGFGTHLQLGLPECGFRSATGMNCPHCGMTTSFALFVRGQWHRSFLVNPAGLILALSAVVLCPWFLTVAIRGHWIGLRSPGMFFVYSFAGWVLLSLILWLLRAA